MGRRALLLLLASAVLSAAAPAPVSAGEPPPEERLAARVTLNFSQTPVSEALELLEAMTGLSFVSDFRVERAREVTLKLQGVTVREAVERLGLEVTPIAGVLYVHPPELELGEVRDPGEGPFADKIRTTKLKLHFATFFTGLNVLEKAGFPVKLGEGARRQLAGESVKGWSEEVPCLLALTALTGPFGLAWRVEGDTIWIETPEELGRGFGSDPPVLRRRKKVRLREPALEVKRPDRGWFFVDPQGDAKALRLSGILTGHYVRAVLWHRETHTRIVVLSWDRAFYGGRNDPEAAVEATKRHFRHLTEQSREDVRVGRYSARRVVLGSLPKNQDPSARRPAYAEFLQFLRPADSEAFEIRLVCPRPQDVDAAREAFERFLEKLRV